MELYYNHTTNLEIAMRLCTLQTQLLMPDWANENLFLNTLPNYELTWDWVFYQHKYWAQISIHSIWGNNWVGRVLNLMSIHSLVECLKISFQSLNLCLFIELVEYSLSLLVDQVHGHKIRTWPLFSVPAYWLDQWKRIQNIFHKMNILN